MQEVWAGRRNRVGSGLLAQGSCLIEELAKEEENGQHRKDTDVVCERSSVNEWENMNSVEGSELSAKNAQEWGKKRGKEEHAYVFKGI